MLSMIKTGAAKLPLDRVPDLARALDVDPGRLLRLALEQSVGDTAARALAETFEIISSNERAWLEEIRDVSGNSDPALTARLRVAFRALFGKP